MRLILKRFQIALERDEGPCKLISLENQVPIWTAPRELMDRTLVMLFARVITAVDPK